MKYGLFGMNMRPCVTPEAIAAVARAAEAAGFDSFWGGEHLALADPHTASSPMPPETVFVDLCATIAFASAHTRTLRFGTGIMLLPLRNPVVLAKQIASVDVISGGRLIFGVGIGNLEFEFEAVGMPFDHKGWRAEEAIAAMRALWSMERAEFRGRYFSFGGVRAEPRPLQNPHPPIIFGGKSAYAFGRTARVGNGWYGYGLDLAAAAICVGGLRAACLRHGRRFDELEINLTPTGELDREQSRRYEDLGVHRLILPPRGRTTTETLGAIADAQRTLLRYV
ncbi:MAG TPA: TIGR03619 family F420-dependent LLM class oxidoreductase [Candidatus Binataceae bacterium]|nr:TIGR03619 family F420-dependent LLM class oxidoreductase [Candidatus Binataceae bacterium]